MRCRKIKKKLSAFIDSELDQKMKSDVEKHLTVCSACNQELKALTHAYDAIEVWERIATSDNFETNFGQKMRERERKLTLLKRLSSIAVPASAIALVTILISGLLSGIYLANVLYPKETKVTTENSLSVMGENFFYLEDLEDLPPKSVGGVYLDLLSPANLKKE